MTMCKSNLRERVLDELDKYEYYLQVKGGLQYEKLDKRYATY